LRRQSSGKRITLAKLRPDRAIKSILWKTVHFARKYKYREKKTSYGNENSDKIFYIIGFPDYTDGLFAIISAVLKHIVYARRFEFIPVVDFQNFKTQYLNNMALGKENAWEYFFEQPMGFSLKDLNKSKNIILSTKISNPRIRVLDYEESLLLDNLQLREYYNYLFMTYIRFNRSTKEYLDNDEKKIFLENRKILGILCRGTDFILKKPPGHEIQPETKDVIFKAENILREYKCSHIYLATEDQEIYSAFKKHFGDAILSNEQKRFSHVDMENVQYLAHIPEKRKNDKYFIGLEYLSSVNILSKCPCFIGGRTTGTFGVYSMTKGFEYDYTFNLGKYPVSQPKLIDELRNLITGNL
jgi:hypothetical protein